MWPVSLRPRRNAAKRCSRPLDAPLLSQPTTGIGCCAHATSGHAPAPPISVMNSRRLMAAPPAVGPSHRPDDDSTLEPHPASDYLADHRDGSPQSPSTKSIPALSRKPTRPVAML